MRGGYRCRAALTTSDNMLASDVRTRIVFFGEDPRDVLQQAAVDFLQRAGKRVDAGLVALTPEKRGKGQNDDVVKRKEGERILAATTGCTRIVLDAAGVVPKTSHAFAADFEKWSARGKPVAFLIGGASGHDDSVRAAADVVLSLSPLTLAHRLAVCVLAEQLYRAAEIHRGGPYAR
jgi:23S rRNA (pseudouridine1915-N3)-methyltransferase